MKPKQLKKFLLSEIKLVSKNVNEYCFSKGKDFTRNAFNICICTTTL